MRLAIYTCVVNDYDVVLPPARDCDGVEFFCFTDKPERRIKGWKMMCLAHPGEVVSPSLINRYHKFFPERVLPKEIDCSIYVDGNVRVTENPRSWAEEHGKDGVPIVVFAHPDRNTIKEE
ncbi:MAG: hypothetical protein AAGJ79_12320, partial [Verrucomicrobiota bacterium]